MPEYLIRIHHEFGYPLDYIYYDLNLLTGWTLYSWAYGSDGLNRFGGLRLSSSPASKEAERLLYELKKFNGLP